jgi:hypothetical protein
MQELEKMLKKLLEDARTLPPGQNRHELLKDIGRLGVKIAAIQKQKSYSKLNEAASVDLSQSRSQESLASSADGSSKAIAGKAVRERDISRPRELTTSKLIAFAQATL